MDTTKVVLVTGGNRGMGLETCPGWGRTDMGGGNADLSVEEGVDTAVWLATSDEAQQSGGFYRKRELIDW